MALGLEVPPAVAEGAWIEWRPVRPPYGPHQQSAAGRRAAAAALAAAGSADRIVSRDPGGRPRFPRGFAGSISHTDRLAVAAVVPGAEAVGIDIENATISPRVTEFVLRERERRVLLPPVTRYTPRELFSAKEAAFKAMNGVGTLGEFLFWQIELSQSDGTLIASYGGERIPVWVRSEAGLSLALAIRR
ncbi:4'-phosphopantetheinyl transferase superfamily protein [Microbispora sp. NPDC088329]|uniref:4'-phosphopantetheinyl transferase superfamily protein n=1 Tax=Microbispora sp. NPDC088329 TaxID=3154869 RepID=UPI00341F6820